MNMAKYMAKIPDAGKLGDCENCGKWTHVEKYGRNSLTYFSITQQFETENFFCCDECAEEKTGNKVI